MSFSHCATTNWEMIQTTNNQNNDSNKTMHKQIENDKENNLSRRRTKMCQANEWRRSLLNGRNEEHGTQKKKGRRSTNEGRSDSYTDESLFFLQRKGKGHFDPFTLVASNEGRSYREKIKNILVFSPQLLGVPVKMLDAQNNRLWFRCESISKSQIEVNGNEFFGKTTYPSKLLLLYGLYRTISFVGQLKMK